MYFDEPGTRRSLMNDEVSQVCWRMVVNILARIPPSKLCPISKSALCRQDTSGVGTTDEEICIILDSILKEIG